MKIELFILLSMLILYLNSYSYSSCKNQFSWKCYKILYAL